MYATNFNAKLFFIIMFKYIMDILLFKVLGIVEEIEQSVVIFFNVEIIHHQSE